MKVPISKQLIENLITPFSVVTGLALYEIYSVGQERFNQDILAACIFGIPTVLFIWLWFDKRIEFKENKKVRKADRIPFIQLTSFACILIFSFSIFIIVAGLIAIVTHNSYHAGIPLILFGLTIFTLTAIAHEHPRIWFSDTFNLEDELERMNGMRQDNHPLYEDGIFTYADNSFTIQLDDKTQTINWDDITLIRTYKVDQYTFDCIVIEIYLKKTFITINDQTLGHMKFMDNAAKKLQGFKQDWFGVVAYPAFETNLTTIYERQQT
ncbi:MAG: hypothetical protein RI955_1309 [Bacteroidota bacterium]|jgi:hypothetical protein